jgi:hypothetical protein
MKIGGTFKVPPTYFSTLGTYSCTLATKPDHLWSKAVKYVSSQMTWL